MTDQINQIVRPLLAYELSIQCQKILSYPNPNQLLLSHRENPHPFTFDYVFDDYSTQSAVYQACVEPLVQSFLNGYNATVLAYGQTGSGKTHTMGTAASEDTINVSPNDPNLGIIPRVITTIFNTIHDRQYTHVHTVKISFLEIYNEEIKDLLNVSSYNPNNLPYIREGPNNSIIVANLVEEAVESPQNVLNLLITGSNNRKTGSTNMNATSSRSHAIFSIILSQKRINNNNDSSSNNNTTNVRNEEAEEISDEVLVSKFHFVDLAGSERLKRTGAIGERMKEGISINCGLLALGNVISALGDEKKKAQHVPFRDSKITRILQDSLGGNRKTLMIACISPADINADETINTLKYANRAKNIKNKPIINRDPMTAKMEALKSRIVQLETALNAYTTGNITLGNSIIAGSSSSTNTTGNTSSGSNISNNNASYEAPLGTINIPLSEYSLLQDQNALYDNEIKKLQQRIKELKEEISNMRENLISTETIRDNYRLKTEMLEKGKFNDTKDNNNDIIKNDATKNISSNSSDIASSDAVVSDILSVDVGLLEENRRTIHNLTRQVNRQKKQLNTATKLLEQMQINLLSQHNNTTSSLNNEKNLAITNIPLQQQLSMIENSGNNTNEMKKKKRKKLSNDNNMNNNPLNNPNKRISNEQSEDISQLQQVEKQGGVGGEMDEANEEDVNSSSAPLSEEDDEAGQYSSSDVSDDDLLGDGGNVSDTDSTTSLHLLAELKEKEYQLNLQQFNEAELKLSNDLTYKTKELFTLSSQTANIQYLQTQYEKKINEMEHKIDAIQIERDKALIELDANKGNNDYESKYEAVVKKYKAQLQVLTEELKSTKLKLLENDKMKKQLVQDEKKIKLLEGEITTAKKAKVALAKKIEESAEKYRQWCDMKETKLKSMQKEQRKTSIYIKQMETQVAKQNLVLARRNEEKTKLQQLVRQAENKKIEGRVRGRSSREGSINNSNTTNSNNNNPTTSSLLINTRRTPARTPNRRPPRRPRASPLAAAQAAAMATSSAALSDSAAPLHHSAGNNGLKSENMNGEQLVSAMEEEIRIGVERRWCKREMNSMTERKHILMSQLTSLQERMMSRDMTSKEEQMQYVKEEKEVTGIQTTLATLEAKILQLSQSLERMKIKPTPSKPTRRTNKPTPADDDDDDEDYSESEKKGAVFLPDSDIDYRLFSRIKVNSVENGKKAMVWLMSSAVERETRIKEMEKDIERLALQREEEKRYYKEKEQKLIEREKQLSVQRRLSTNQLKVHYEGRPDDDQAKQEQISSNQSAPAQASIPSFSTYSHISSHPSPPVSPSQSMLIASRHSASSSSHHSPLPHASSLPANLSSYTQTSPQPPPTPNHSTLTNNYLLPDDQETVPPGKKGKVLSGNVFTRLTDTSSFTGMYKSIAEEKRKVQQISSNISIKRQNNKEKEKENAERYSASNREKSKENAKSSSQQTNAQHASSMSHHSIAVQPTPLNPQSHNAHPFPPLENPPLSVTATSIIGTGTNITSLLAGSNGAVTSTDPRRHPESVFSRLTNPQLYTGAHRARFGLDVQAARHKVEGEGINSNNNVTGAFIVNTASIRSTTNSTGSKVSPNRSSQHSRGSSHADFLHNDQQPHSSNPILTNYHDGVRSLPHHHSSNSFASTLPTDISSTKHRDRSREEMLQYDDNNTNSSREYEDDGIAKSDRSTDSIDEKDEGDNMRVADDEIDSNSSSQPYTPIFAASHPPIDSPINLNKTVHSAPIFHLSTSEKDLSILQNDKGEEDSLSPRADEESVEFHGDVRVHMMTSPNHNNPNNPIIASKTAIERDKWSREDLMNTSFMIMTNGKNVK